MPSSTSVLIPCSHDRVLSIGPFVAVGGALSTLTTLSTLTVASVLGRWSVRGVLGAG